MNPRDGSVLVLLVFSLNIIFVHLCNISGFSLEFSERSSSPGSGLASEMFPHPKQVEGIKERKPRGNFFESFSCRCPSLHLVVQPCVCAGVALASLTFA